ncbi:MAG: hypothetical protein ABI548_29490 [Polyangiaceae bacterium]
MNESRHFIDEVDLVEVQDFNAPDEPLPTQVARGRTITHALGGRGELPTFK